MSPAWIEFFICFVVCLFVITQILIPCFSNVRFFWIFRRSQKNSLKREKEMADIADESHDFEMAREVERAKQGLRERQLAAATKEKPKPKSKTKRKEAKEDNA